MGRDLLAVPRVSSLTYGQAAFSFYHHHLWNSLWTSLQQFLHSFFSSNGSFDVSLSLKLSSNIVCPDLRFFFFLSLPAWWSLFMTVDCYFHTGLKKGLYIKFSSHRQTTNPKTEELTSLCDSISLH